jgi:hypothetical protein
LPPLAGICCCTVMHQHGQLQGCTLIHPDQQIGGPLKGTVMMHKSHIQGWARHILLINKTHKTTTTPLYYKTNPNMYAEPNLTHNLEVHQNVLPGVCPCCGYI